MALKVMRNQDYPPKKWTDAELEQVRQLRAAGMGYADIARKIGRNISSVWVKFEKRPERRISGKPPPDCIPDFVFADRRRRSALSRQTVTSEICGDPLPGYSAADRKLG